MNASPKLKVIASNTTGVPHIDMAAAADKGITVCSLKDEQAFLDTITPTAEHTWGLLLALSRKVPWAHDAATQGSWNRRNFSSERMLSRMKLGLIGCGRLGSRVAKYGLAFDMKVSYFDPYKDLAVDGVSRVHDLKELVKNSDVVSLHVPALPETKNLISNEIFNTFKPGAYFINTARGEVIDERALLEALEEGRLSGVATDVLDGEYVPGFHARDHPLVQYAKTHTNLLLTPHIGGSTRDAWFETERKTIEMVISVFAQWDDK